MSQLCRRFDRKLCPFHGLIIARNDDGTPVAPIPAAAARVLIAAPQESAKASKKAAARGEGDAAAPAGSAKRKLASVNEDKNSNIVRLYNYIII